MSVETQSHRYLLYLLLSLTILPLAIRIIAPFVEIPFWGLNHAAYSAQWLAIALGVILVVEVALFFRQGVPQNTNIADSTWKLFSRPTVHVFVTLACGTAFFFGSGDFFLYGSGYYELSNIPQIKTPHLHPRYLGASWLDSSLLAALPHVYDRALNQAGFVFRLESALAGALTILLWIRIAVTLATNSQSGLVMLTMIVASGVTLLFFGVGYHYSVATLLITMCVYAFVRLNKAQSTIARVVYALLLLVIGALLPLYMSSLVFVWPALIFMIGVSFSKSTSLDRILGVMSVLALVALVVVVYTTAEGDLWVAARLMPFGEKPPEFDYSLLSSARIFDLLSAKLTLMPLYPLCIFIILFTVWRFRCDRIVCGLTALTGCSIVAAFVLDYPGGAPREIVTVAPFFVAPLYLAGYLWSKWLPQLTNATALTRPVLVTALMSIILVAPVFMFSESAAAHLSDDLDTRSGRNRTGIINFRDHYFYKMEFSTADTWEWSLKARSEEHLDLETVKGMMARGYYTDALNRISLIESSHPYWDRTYAVKASALSGLNRDEEAVLILEKALQLNPRNVENQTRLGNAHKRLGRFAEAEQSYQQALQLDPQFREALAQYGMLLYQLGRFDDADRYAFLLFEFDPRYPHSFLIRGLTSFERKEYGRAMRFFSKISVVADQLPEWPIVSEIMTEIRRLRPDLQ